MYKKQRELRGFRITKNKNGSLHYSLQFRHKGRAFYKAIGTSKDYDEGEARRRAHQIIADIKTGTRFAPYLPHELLFENVSEDYIKRQARIWKPSTMKLVRKLFDYYLISYFKGQNIADITRQHVLQWPERFTIICRNAWQACGCQNQPCLFA